MEGTYGGFAKTKSLQHRQGGALAMAGRMVPETAEKNSRGNYICLVAGKRAPATIQI